MRPSVILLATLAAGLSAPASAIVVNENLFASHGGQVSNIHATIATAFAPMQATSRANPFYTVGDLGHCSATWLGDRDGYAWFLTSAQCVADSNVPMQAVVMRFVDWQGTVIADGQGWRYLPPARIDPASGLPLAATDIALVRLPSKAAIRDAAGHAVEPARLYAGANERTRPTTFIGHGAWGVGSQNNSHWTALDGSRRVLGRSITDAYRYSDHTLVAGYSAKGATTRSARTTASDGGAPWWQHQEGVWAIVGTTHGNTNTQSHATRVSPYVAWIKSVFPDARSDLDPAAKLTDLAPYVSRADAHLAWSVPSGQPGVTGPVGNIQSSVAILVDATDQVTGVKRTVHLRAGRPAGGSLDVRFDPADNPGLPSGAYRATFAVDATTSQVLQERVRIAMDVVRGVRGRVTHSSHYVSPNWSPIANGAVYFVVPAAQGIASGPTGSTFYGDHDTHSIIRVQVTRDGTSQPVTLTLRGERTNGCRWRSMNSHIHCTVYTVYQYTGILRASYHATDNAGLAPGRYRGTAYIEAKGWQRTLRDVIALEVDIDTR